MAFDNLTCSGGATIQFQLQKQCNYKDCDTSVRLRHAFCHTILLLSVLFMWRLKMTCKNGAPWFSCKAVISACSSGRKLSWKIQESEKGTLIQLVWKAANSFAGDLGKKTEVRSNWNNSPPSNRQSIIQRPQSRNPPSRVRRNARRLKAFIECKQTTQTTQEYREVSESGKCDSGNTNSSAIRQMVPWQAQERYRITCPHMPIPPS